MREAFIQLVPRNGRFVPKWVKPVCARWQKDNVCFQDGQHERRVTEIGAHSSCTTNDWRGDNVEARGRVAQAIGVKSIAMLGDTTPERDKAQDLSL